MTKTLNQLRDEAHANSVAKGFHESPQSIGDAVALMHSELSELLEDARDGRDPNDRWYEEKIPAFDAEGRRLYVDEEVPTYVVIKHRHNPNRDLKPCGIPSEVADLIIRALDFCGKHEIDLDEAFSEKMAFNATRPRKHGGKAF